MQSGPNGFYVKYLSIVSVLISGVVQRLLQPVLRQPRPQGRIVHQGLRELQDQNLRAGQEAWGCPGQLTPYYIFELFYSIRRIKEYP